MAKEFNLKWDQAGERLYETGVDRGVLFPTNEEGKYGDAAAWNGLSAVNENPTGAEPNPLYADNVKYLELMSVEEFGCGIECYTYPDEFKPCIGEVELAPGVYATQQTRLPFGFSYRTLIGNDVKGTDFGYKIHLVYGAKASVSERANATINESPEAMTMSYDITTTPVAVTGAKPLAHLVIDSTKCSADKLAALEEMLYGTGETKGKLPMPDEVVAMLKAA